MARDDSRSTTGKIESSSMAQVRQKLKAARESWADDSKTDHEALGHLLDLFEEQAGVEPGAESVATAPDSVQA